MQKIISIISMLSMLILSACNNLIAVEPSVDDLSVQGVPKNVPAGETPEQEVLFPVGGHEQARDFVVAHVAELTGLSLSEGEWVFQDQSQHDPDDGLTWLFTNGPWVVQVSAPAIAPEPMEFFVTVDHVSAIIRWEGMVDSFGNIVETNFTQGSQPESPEKPRELSWIGVIVSNPPGSQFDDYFQSMDQNGTRYGIDGAGELIKEQLLSYRDTGIVIKVWGTLQNDVPDAYGSQILTTRIEPY